MKKLSRSYFPRGNMFSFQIPKETKGGGFNPRACNLSNKMKKTIKLNGNTFTTAGDFIETLFSPINGKTAAGFYAKKKNGILFHKPDGSPWFFLVANKHGERFFVSCGTANNRLFYMNALCSSDEKQLGIEGMKYSEEIALAERIWEEFEPSQAIALS